MIQRETLLAIVKQLTQAIDPEAKFNGHLNVLDDDFFHVDKVSGEGYCSQAFVDRIDRATEHSEAEFPYASAKTYQS